MTIEFTLAKTYEPAEIEKAIYDSWMQSGAFHAVPDARPRERRYVVMMPLPNVTGALHMGHAMDNSMQDLLIRWHRMLGDNTLWMPGTDHAGIATQAVVEKRLRELEGLTRHDIGRERLVERIWAWKDQYQARIVSQLQRLGCSCDWSRQRFTMDRVCARAVRHAFFRMFGDGLIFRGKRLVNWDPFLRTSISDDEVYHETVKGHFWHLRYPIVDPQPGEPSHVIVATTRPETMLGDTAVAVHPDPAGALQADIDACEAALGQATDKERPALEATLAALRDRQATVLPGLLTLCAMARAGRKVLLPLLDRTMPLIADEWAKPSLGSGCVKITPAHDPNDYDVWRRQAGAIDILNILNPDGTLNAVAGPYQGLDRFVARDRVVADLQAQGLLAAIEDRDIDIGHSDRSKTPVEPYLSDQWFVNMGDVPGGIPMGAGTDKPFRAAGLVQAAIDAAESGRVQFHPPRFLKTYLDWLREKRDWPVSRQLWWGHRIPVWSLTVTGHELATQLAAPSIATLLAAPDRVRIRVVRPGDDASFPLVGAAVPDALRVQPNDAYRLDICLRDDDPALLHALADLGALQEEDVLDTWYSSALWPHSTLGWPDAATADTEGGAPLGAEAGQSDCLDYYYPGSCLVTARDIITLWVARMVVVGLYNLGDIPFSDVFIHANILDGKGERMSKSKGNGIDPVDIIEAYGADAMRYVLCDMQTGNQDIRLPVVALCPHCEHHNDLADTAHGGSVFTYQCAACGQEFDVLGTMANVPSAKLISERFLDGRKFCNKLWNTARFALGHLQDVAATPVDRAALPFEDRWVLAALNEAVRAVTAGLQDYNPSAALGAARDFMWGTLCDWYLELIKPRLQDPNDPSGRMARQVLAYCLDQTLRLLHPFVPYVSEYLFRQLNAQVPVRTLPGLAEAPASASLISAAWPVPAPALDDPDVLRTFAGLQAATTGVRDIRSRQRLSPSEPLTVTLRVVPERAAALAAEAHVVQRLAGVATLRVDPQAQRPSGAASLVVGELAIFVHDVIDDAAERARLTAELGRLTKEIDACQRKLTNENFLQRAPADVVREQWERKTRYEQQQAAVREALGQL